MKAIEFILLKSKRNEVLIESEIKLKAKSHEVLYKKTENH